VPYPGTLKNESKKPVNLKKTTKGRAKIRQQPNKHKANKKIKTNQQSKKQKNQKRQNNRPKNRVFETT